VDTGGKHSTPHAAGAHRFGVKWAAAEFARQFERMAEMSASIWNAPQRFLEKNASRMPIEAYLAVLGEAPLHQEATQALGDLYARMDGNRSARAVYYGMLFDLLLIRRRDKGLAIYNRFLRSNSARSSRAHRALRFLNKNKITRRSDRGSNTKAAELSPQRPARKMRFFAGSVSRNGS